MDQIITFLTRRNIIALTIIAVLAVGLLVGVRLVQQQTQLKSKADQPTFGSIVVGKSSITKVGSNWESIPITVNISVPGADNSKTVAGVYIIKTENVSSGVGWTAISKFYGSNGVDSFSWTPPGSYGAGSYTFGLFHMDQNTVLDVIQTSSPVEFTTSTVSPTPSPTPPSGGQPASPCQTSNWQLSNQSPPPNTKVDVTVQGSGNVTWQNVQLRDNGSPVCGVGTDCSPPLSSYPVGNPTIRASVNSGAAGSRHNLTISIDNGAVACSGGTSFTTQGGGSTGVLDAAECKNVVFKKNGQLAPSLFENQKYDVEITMDNKDYNNTTYQGPTWTVGNLSAGTGYFLGFPTQGDSGAGDFRINTDTSGTNLSINSLWQVNWTDPAKLRIPLGTSVPAGGSNTFKFTITPQKAGTHTFYWSMIHEGVNWFGGQCVSNITVQSAACPKAEEPGTKQTCGLTTYDTCVDDKGQTEANFCKGSATKFRCYWSNNPNNCISGTSATDFNYSCSACTTTPVPDGTACFFMDDKPIIAKSCTDTGARAYDTHPKVEPLILTTAGKKTIFARFISNLGAIKDFQRVINFIPNPAITEVSCTHSVSGQGTQITITATGLGVRTNKSKVKVGGNDATIINWNEATGTITATLDKRIEGKNDVEVTRDDGKVLRAECTIGITSVLFTAQSQCKSQSGNFAADNVSVKIFADVPTTIDAEKPDPIIDEKVKLDKDGKPSGFAPKLEKNKKYSLIVKAPGTLAKRTDFETKGGTRNLDPFTLLIGDIAPAAKPDGKINAFDRAELTRQWSLIRDVTRSGDFNQDARVNSIDYACMRQNINQSDEEFSPTVPKASATPDPTVSPSPSPSLPPISAPIVLLQR